MKTRQVSNNGVIFSIITPTWNPGKKLVATIESVLAQDCAALEHLVIDRQSTDETLQLIQPYLSDHRVRLISDPTLGMYEAMNKGIELSSGRFLYFLGAGDLLLPNTLGKIMRLLPPPGRTMLYGNVLWRSTQRRYDGRFTRGKLRRENICHQAIFYERSIFEIVGKYETKYPFWSDWAFNMKCFGERSICKNYIDAVIADYEGNGLSMTRLDEPFTADYPELVRSHLGPVQYRLHKAAPILARWKGTLLRR